MDDTRNLETRTPRNARSGTVGRDGGALLELDDVSLILSGNEILRSLDLEIGREEFVCFVGPSGCGKTSILRLLGGLFTPQSGSVRYTGQDLGGPNRDIAIVFQDYANALLPWRTAHGNVSLALEALNTPRSERDSRISELLRLVGLAGKADHYPAQFSGGMQQRLQIARCLAQEPSVILMDEPFGALDAMTRQTLQDEVQRIVSSRRMSVCFVTHDIEEAIYLGDRVVALQASPGRIGEVFEVAIPRPRDQLSTREHPEFLRLRRELFRFIEAQEK